MKDLMLSKKLKMKLPNLLKNLKSLNEMLKRMLMLLKKLLLNYLKQKEIDIILLMPLLLKEEM